MDKKNEKELEKVKGGDKAIEEDPTVCKKEFDPIACRGCNSHTYGFPIDVDHCDKGYY